MRYTKNRQVAEGKAERLADFGIFVRIAGRNGLLNVDLLAQPNNTCTITCLFAGNGVEINHFLDGMIETAKIMTK